MIQIPYKKSMARGLLLSNGLQIVVRRLQHKWYASILDTKTNKIAHSNYYENPKRLNNFFKKYDVELIFDREEQPIHV